MSADGNPLSRVVARALEDEAFRQELIADPAAVLAAEGVAVPEGVTVKVVADTASVRHLVVPLQPRRELADAELAGIHGGWTCPWECKDCGAGEYA